MKTIGRSIIMNAFSVMAGFSAPDIFRIHLDQAFVLLVIISTGSCLIGALVIAPSNQHKPGFIGLKM